jgi:hypothetical protein
MDASMRREPAIGLESVRQRFDEWRQTRHGHARIPERLWLAAVKAAGVHGLHRTVRALRVDYYSLKERVEQQARTIDVPAATDVASRPATRGVAGRAATSGVTGRRRSSAGKRSGRRRSNAPHVLPAFVEVTPTAVPAFAPVPAGACQYIVEWEDAAGAKMRVEVKGTALPDLAALSRSFWNPAS